MEYNKSTNYTIEEFKDIIEMLRSENGCPWDRVQTHESLKLCMMEEAAEVLAGIRILNQTGNGENLKEELGDVLLQVMMHSQIAKEEDLFSFEDVVDDISRKMIRRHPHVFVQEPVNVDSVEQVLTNWEDIKKKEKQGKEWAAQPLREIPIELPALTRGTKVIKKLNKLYQPQPDLKEISSNLRLLSEKVAILADQIEENEKNEKNEDVGANSAKSLKQDLELHMSELLWQICGISAKFGITNEQILDNKIDDIVDKYEPYNTM